MEYTTKLVYQSNYWYNDGLQKAKIRDLSGAVKSLRKSLQYNQANIAARNLLGLVYYGRGDVIEALVEWILSKNIQSHDNIANYYISKVQEVPGELETINQVAAEEGTDPVLFGESTPMCAYNAGNSEGGRPYLNASIGKNYGDYFRGEPNGMYAPVSPRHNDSANYIFRDGSGRNLTVIQTMKDHRKYFGPTQKYDSSIKGWTWI